MLDEGQPCEQAEFREGFSTVDHIHTISKFIEGSREYKMALSLTFIDLKKAFDSAEMEAVVEALDNQGVPTPYIKVLREFYSNFTTGISRFADDVVLITPSISQAERMLTEFDETCRCIGLQLNLQKKMCMRNGWVSDAPFTLNEHGRMHKLHLSGSGIEHDERPDPWAGGDEQLGECIRSPRK